MRAIMIFRHYRNADRDAAAIQSRIEMLRGSLTSISPQSSDQGSVSHGAADGDRIGRLVAEIDEKQRELELVPITASVERVAICILLKELPGLESNVLYAYYVERKTAAAIARQLNYQDSYIRKLKAKAEKMLDAIPEERIRAALPAWYLRKNGEQ